MTRRIVSSGAYRQTVCRPEVDMCKIRRVLKLLVFVVLYCSSPACGLPKKRHHTPIPDDSMPSFGTAGLTIKAVINETVVIPCDVVNAGTYMTVWKKGIAILTAGNHRVTPDTRMRLVNDTNLEISQVEINDAGNYVCQIATMSPKELSHTVEVMVPPRIKTLAVAGTAPITKDSVVTINCDADGNPVPNITWSRKNNMLPNGDKFAYGEQYVIESAIRYDTGTYVCSADNGVGSPIEQSLYINVLFPPEVKVESEWVHTGEGREAQLVCLVEAEPAAEVFWYKDTLKLDLNERRLKHTRGSRHTLILRKIQAIDFGNYSCMAVNEVGKVKGYMELSGKPNGVKIKSEQIGRYMNDFNLVWSTDSYTPIEEFKLFYRKVPDESSTNRQIKYQLPKKPPIRNNNDGYGVGSPVYGYNTLLNEWNDLLLPAVPSEQFTHTMSYHLRNLDNASEYEAKVMAKNRFGWTPPSQVFKFNTSATPEMDSNPKYQASHGSSMTSNARDVGSASYVEFTRRNYKVFLLVVLTNLYISFHVMA